MRLSTAHATSEIMNQEQIAAGELQQGSTCFVMVKEIFPRPDSTPAFRNRKNITSSAVGGSGITDVNRKTARFDPIRVNECYQDFSPMIILWGECGAWYYPY